MKKYLLRTTLLLTIAFVSSSCKSYIQYFDVGSDLPIKNTQYTFENDDCEIILNFWKENGNSSFILYNKSDKGLYIDLEKSAISLNGVSYPLSNEEFKVSLVQNVFVTPFLFDYGVSVMNSTEINIPKHQHIICVVPNSLIYLNRGSLCDNAISFADYDKDYPRTSFQEHFTKDESPLRFSYWISYSRSDDKVTKSVNAEFYISKVENRKERNSVKTKLFETSNGFVIPNNQNIDVSPRRFYIIKGNTINFTNKKYDEKKMLWKQKHGWNIE